MVLKRQAEKMLGGSSLSFFVRVFLIFQQRQLECTGPEISAGRLQRDAGDCLRTDDGFGSMRLLLDGLQGRRLMYPTAAHAHKHKGISGNN